MADLEQTLREIFGESMDRVSRFRTDQIKKLNEKLREVARESLRDDLVRMQSDIADLKNRVAQLEAERVRSTEEV